MIIMAVDLSFLNKIVAIQQNMILLMRNFEKFPFPFSFQFLLLDIQLTGLIKMQQSTIKYKINCIMNKCALTAANFLKSTEMREKYECGVCYQVCIKPVKCKGQCSKIFCMKCVSDIRQKVDRCPLKCSSPFLVQRILPDISLQFYCPYNPSLCQIPINSTKQFNQHYKQCSFVSPEELQYKRLQRQYRCIKGHQLQFFIGSYEQMIESKCTLCEQINLCRSMCRICDSLYCVQCRIPPCSKEGCPARHSYIFERIANLNFLCDICGVSTSVSNDGVYDDNICNFGICQGCYQQLPDKLDQSKPKQLIININSLCICGNNLQYVQSMNKANFCSLCTKLKQCPKQCKNCDKKYCLSCKIMDINNDDTCGLDHSITLNVSAGIKEQGQIQFGCMKCGKSQVQYYFDEICRTRLCFQCLEYCKMVTADKQRPIITKCSKNHVLFYLQGRADCYSNCSCCKKKKIIKLKCKYCAQQGLNFCFECKPILLQTCYYKHKLILAKFQSERECHFCMKSTNQFHYCKKCYFYVCKECLYQNIHSKKMQIEQQKNQLSSISQFQLINQKMEQEI